MCCERCNAEITSPEDIENNFCFNCGLLATLSKEEEVDKEIKLPIKKPRQTRRPKNLIMTLI